MSFFLLFLIAALSLRSFDGRRQYPADMAGYYSRCPSCKSKTIRSRSDSKFCPGKSAGLKVCDSLRLSAANLKIYW